MFNMIRVLAKQKTGLKLVHLNAQSLNNKLDEFQHIFLSSGIDIICVSETWFHCSINDSVYNLPGYKLFRADRESFAGGTCIYIRNGIKSTVKIKSAFGNPIEYLFIELHLKENQRVLVGSVYRPNRHIPINDLLSTIANISMMYNDIIISGDFNSNLLVEDALTDSFRVLDLYPTNTNRPTHFHRSGNSLLDIILLNHKTKVLLYDQLSAPMFSNHDLLFISYDITTKVEDEIISFRDFKNVNYCLLEQYLLNTNWENIYNIQSIDEQVTFLQENCNEILNICVPIKSIKIKHTEKPWFNNNIKQLIIQRDAFYKRWKRYKTPELFLLYRTAKSCEKYKRSKVLILPSEVCYCS